MLAELKVVISYWERMLAVLNERIKPLIIDLDHNKEPALRLLIDLLQLSIKLFKTVDHLRRLSLQIIYKKWER